MKEIDQIKMIINGMKLKNIPLMKKSEADKRVKESYVYTHANKVDELSNVDVFIGGKIHTHEPLYGDPTYWKYDEGVEEKIKDDCLYKIWYTYRDASDPYDSTSWYRVWYIEKIPKEKAELVEFLKITLKELQ